MKAKDNQVYLAAMMFCRSFEAPMPEKVIYGYAKLLSMDEKQVRNLIPDESMNDLETAHNWFAEKNLDINLIKSGMIHIVPFIPEDMAQAGRNRFQKFLETEAKEEITSVSILDWALKEAFIPFQTVFAAGSEWQQIEEYKKELKEKYPADREKGQHTENSEQNGQAVTETSGEKQEGQPEAGRVSPEEEPWWSVYHQEFVRLLKTSYLGDKQIESVTERIRHLSETLPESDQEKLMEILYLSLSEVKGLTELLEAHDEYYDDDRNHEKHAKYRTAEHTVMRNIWQCLVQFEKEHLFSGNILAQLSAKYDKVYQSLIQQVIGQDHAVNEFVRACFDAEMYDVSPDHPQAVFLFAGPPGVGKTFLARSAARLLGRPFKIFDMGAYATDKADLGLIGTEKLFTNATEGTLVQFVEDHPDAILLFDEMEKAHPDVTRLFLSILEGARLENKFLASNTDFSHTIVIFTTNAARSIYEENRGNLSAIPTEVIIKELEKEKDALTGQPKLPPELCSRLASRNIVMFNHIGISDMVRIITTHMNEACKEIQERLNISIEYDSRLALLLLMHFGNIDARVVTGQARQFIKREIYELSRQLVRTDGITDVRKICFSIDDNRISDKAKAFFAEAETEGAHLVVVCNEETAKKLESAPLGQIRLDFVESEDELLEYAPEDTVGFLVDPYYKMRRADRKILGLEDYDSMGLRIIKKLLEKNSPVPVFLLESGKKISRTDKNTLYMRGVEDTVCLDDHAPEKIIARIVSNHLLQKKSTSMMNRRKIFDFESLQEKPDREGVVHVRFYDIAVKDAVNPEDQKLLLSIEERPEAKFEDVIGAENAVAQLKDFEKYLADPKGYMKHAMTVPKGVLLYGPPGTGKTLLARAMAGESDAAFISVSSARLRSEGTEAIEQLFNTARKYAPAIIFLDEVDAIAHKRTGSVYAAYDESLLNMLLTQMDGFEQHKNTPVFLIAATNYSLEPAEDSMEGGLDPAFLRRFGSRILVDLPGKDERIQFLSRRLKVSEEPLLGNKVTSDEIRNIAERTTGVSLAGLENVLELAFRNAAGKGSTLDNELLEETLEEYLYGEKRTFDEDQTYRTAVHEASHAYIYSLSGKKPSYLTVISRGNFAGYMQHEDEEYKTGSSREECIWSIRTSLAGRIGEMVVFGDAAALNTGASSDLRQASTVALRMLTTYGMQDGYLFTMSYEQLLQSSLLPVYAKQAEEILNQQEKECRELIEKGRDRIITLAKALMDKGHLNREEIEKVLGSPDGETIRDGSYE